MAKSKKVNNTKNTMSAVRNMVEFMKDEVDRAVMALSTQDKIDSTNVESVSNVIKMSLESAFIKTAEHVEKATTK
jgi:hypothetical protein